MTSNKKKPEELEKANTELKQQVTEYLDGWKRCKADFENYKRQQEEWAKSFQNYATENILGEIIPVIDNFELAVDHIPQTPENRTWREGILHIKKQLGDILINHGVKKIELKPGDSFDPNTHECIENQPVPPEKCEPASSNQEKPPVIEKIIRNGYVVGDKLLRPAQVTVTRANNQKSAP